MKSIIILVLILGTLNGHPASNRQTEQIPNQNAKHLQLSIFTEKQMCKRRGNLKIMVMLTNTDYVKDIFVYGTLGWGYSSSLSYIIRDASGQPTRPTILADDLTGPINRTDASAFVRLAPNHFLGTSYVEDLKRLGLRKPGKYSVIVEYRCPVSTVDVDLKNDLKNFWSKEDGVIRSNTVFIEVIP